MSASLTILRQTNFPHVYDARGKRLQKSCSGHLQLVVIDERVTARCDTCGAGYRFARDGMPRKDVV